VFGIQQVGIPPEQVSRRDESQNGIDPTGHNNCPEEQDVINPPELLEEDDELELLDEEEELLLELLDDEELDDELAQIKLKSHVGPAPPLLQHKGKPLKKLQVGVFDGS